MESIEEHLQEHGVKPTSVRILVWQQCARQKKTFTLNDLEELLPHMDRSSIFRALRLFVEHEMLHEINDGTGYQKYCVCRCSDHDHHLNHIHFTCIRCGKTYCLEDYTIPLVNLPEGFAMQDAEYIIKGVCPQCGKE
ncbi:MAG: transcriptional repressor [Bacteroidaceae bacterium]|nr:transcriptional repressor [Bacteroidaceae bacterium]